MYFMLQCQSPAGVKRALTSYRADKLPTGLKRNWVSGKPFATLPPVPIRIELEQGEGGALLEMMTGAIPLMSRRLAAAVTAAGVRNIEFFETAIHDLESGQVHATHVAFHLVGTIAAADLSKSTADTSQGSMIAVDFDALSIDPTKTQGALLFRLAESVNGIVVHRHVRDEIERAGIDTLTFLPPEKWVG